MAGQDMDFSLPCLVGCLLETRRQFEVAFQMIDADRSDFVDLEEFNEVGFSNPIVLKPTLIESQQQTTMFVVTGTNGGR